MKQNKQAEASQPPRPTQPEHPSLAVPSLSTWESGPSPLGRRLASPSDFSPMEGFFRSPGRTPTLGSLLCS